MSIDERLIEAVTGIIRAGASHHRLYLIGGQALRDLYAHCLERFGDGIPPVRSSYDVDLLLSMDSDLESFAQFQRALQDEWSQPDPKVGTYLWRQDASIMLDLVGPYTRYDVPGSGANLGIGKDAPRVHRVIPAWLHDLRLIEKCHNPQLRRIGLERLRHGALLISKVLAVDVSLRKAAAGEPRVSWSRLDRDLVDVLMLTDVSIKESLWCQVCTPHRAAIRAKLEDSKSRIANAAASTTVPLEPHEREHLSQMVDSFNLWWP